MIDTYLLIGLILIEGVTMGISEGYLEVANKELLRNALDKGYKLNNKKDINTLSIDNKDKIFMFLILIPIINILVYAYRFYFKTSNNNKIIANHIKNKVLVEMNEAEKEYYKNHKGIDDINLIHEGKIVMPLTSKEEIPTTKKENEFINTHQNKELDSIYELKNTVLNIVKENIDEKEKEEKVVELLREYEIIPSDSKVKKLER